MITIRHGVFETNSSSCHVYVYFPTKDSAKVPATVKLIPNDESTPVQRCFNDYYMWMDLDQESMENFLARLFVIGVKNIRCSDKKVEELVKKVKLYPQGHCSWGWNCDKESFALALFGSMTEMTTISDHLDMEAEVKEKYGEDAEMLAIRLS